MLDFRTDTFLTVCETMNFTEAAKRLHITQTAVSQHIRFLEKEYNTRLFSYYRSIILYNFLLSFTSVIISNWKPV